MPRPSIKKSDFCFAIRVRLASNFATNTLKKFCVFRFNILDMERRWKLGVGRAIAPAVGKRLENADVALAAGTAPMKD